MSKSVQSDPPFFGKAKFVNKIVASLIYKIRKKKSLKVLNSILSNQLISDKISIVILSCKRQKSLERLCASLKNYLQNIEINKNYEIILVDNGSDKELINWAREFNFFNKIYALKENIGMCRALDYVYQRVNSEFTLLIEDDFIIDRNKPFFDDCLSIFKNFPEIGIIRLKNQNNWGKPFRKIGPLRKIKDISFWTWFPTWNYKHNVWCAGSVMFRHIGYLQLGPIKCGKNISRSSSKHQGVYYEEIFAKKFNKIWLAAKIYNCYPFVQLDQENESPGWNDKK